MAKPIIVFRLGSMGDTVVALPCFHKIRACYPSAKITVLTNIPVSSKAAPLMGVLGDTGLVDEALAYPVGVRNPIALGALALKVRGLGAETLIYLQARSPAAARRDVAFFKLCGIKRIIGAPVTDMLSLAVETPNTGEEEFEAQRLTRCLEPLGPIDLTDAASWSLGFTAHERAAADAALAPLAGQRFLAVNTGGKDPSKDWGFANWQAALQLISQTAECGLVFVGAKEDSERADALSPSWRGRVLNLCGTLSPRQTGAVLERAAAFAGHDSGPMHLAAAAQTPCVGLFGGLNRPRRWHPYGAGHVVLHEMAGVERIVPRDMARAVMSRLTP